MGGQTSEIISCCYYFGAVLAPSHQSHPTRLAARRREITDDYTLNTDYGVSTIL
jgi:hypothetical protein